MVAWHHKLKGCELEQAQEDSEGQGSLTCYSPWGHKELDTTEPLNNNSNGYRLQHCFSLFLDHPSSHEHKSKGKKLGGRHFFISQKAARCKKNKNINNTSK